MTYAKLPIIVRWALQTIFRCKADKLAPIFDNVCSLAYAAETAGGSGPEKAAYVVARAMPKVPPDWQALGQTAVRLLLEIAVFFLKRKGIL